MDDLDLFALFGYAITIIGVSSIIVLILIFYL